MTLEYKNTAGDEVIGEIAAEVKALGANVTALKDSMQKDLAEARKLAEEAKSASDPLVKAAIEKHSAAVMEKVEAIQKQVNDVEAKAGRARFGNPTAEDTKANEHALAFHRLALAGRGQLRANTEVKPEDVNVEAFKAYNRAFDGYIRKGLVGEGGFIEAKEMSVGSDPDGGYWVTPAASARMLTIIYESSPIRELATVETIGTDSLELPVDEDESDAGWIGETSSRTSNDGTPQVGVQRIPVHEMYAKPKATQKLLEDGSIDVGAWLERKIAEKFARAEATAFVTGNGVKRPRGFASYSAGSTRGTIEQVNSGAATTLTFDGLIALVTALKEGYHAGATFLMRRATEGTVLTLKDGQGQYLWRPSVEAGKPNTLLGYPVRQAADMAALAAASLSVAFGNFKAGYTIVDRLGVTVLRDPFSSKPFVEFYARKRVGADVTNFEALKLLVTSA